MLRGEVVPLVHEREAEEAVGHRVAAAELDHLDERRDRLGVVLVPHLDHADRPPRAAELRELAHRVLKGRLGSGEVVALEEDLPEREVEDCARVLLATLGVEPRLGIRDPSGLLRRELIEDPLQPLALGGRRLRLDVALGEPALDHQLPEGRRRPHRRGARDLAAGLVGEGRSLRIAFGLRDRGEGRRQPADRGEGEGSRTKRSVHAIRSAHAA